MRVPTVRVRLSGKEIRLIRPGLARIVGGYQIAEQTGSLANAYPFRILQPRNFDHGQFDKELTQLVVKLWDKLPAGDGGWRRRLNCLELAALALGARVTMTRVRHGHLAPCYSNQKTATAHLICRLEMHRKRAKRAFVRRLGEGAYTAASMRWREFVRFLRVHFLYCATCNRPRYPGLRRLRVLALNDCVEIAREGLKERGLAPPPEPELRRAVRLAVEAAHRGRVGFGRREILANRVLGASYLSDAVRQRCHIGMPDDDEYQE